ncbi:hypothetical protein CAPTEDRAFT_202411 [Capitella teleta]|uniref:Gamma-butyrobetaine hydroxylase-like N-terminal domain-containing protein n=1 Tax=Capitella teleta TaxID=283909 RepID=R7UZG2_CAPTE|nr:hypothetical protein CAPTEDRAFT_202411 [Capitella teleta]|eukprot:ELU09352.1 hypothetical protein CAPTEDRAFT_202411 [Capitella teleta]
MSSLTAKPEGDYLRVTSDGKDQLYPSVWLRDNCQCEQCFNPSSTSRKLLMKHLDPAIEVSKAEVTNQEEVNVTWSDGHSGAFSAKWLLPRAFGESTRSRRKSWYALPIKLWNATDMKDGIPRYNFDQIIEKQTKPQNGLN